MRTFVCLVVLTAGLLAVAAVTVRGATQAPPPGDLRARPLKSITINTQAYSVDAKAVDRRSDSITAEEDMHLSFPCPLIDFL